MCLGWGGVVLLCAKEELGLSLLGLLICLLLAGDPWVPSGVTSWHTPAESPQLEREQRSGALTVGLVLGTHVRK